MVDVLFFVAKADVITLCPSSGGYTADAVTTLPPPDCVAGRQTSKDTCSSWRIKEAGSQCWQRAPHSPSIMGMQGKTFLLVFFLTTSLFSHSFADDDLGPDPDADDDEPTEQPDDDDGHDDEADNEAISDVDDEPEFPADDAFWPKREQDWPLDEENDMEPQPFFRRTASQ